MALFALLIFVALSLLASVTSTGFLEADGCTHYLYARHAWTDPGYIVNVWGRPICTAGYAIGAHLAGRFGVRCTSLLIAVGVAIVARAMAKRQRDRASWLVFIITLAQPLLFLHSFSELTELPFALLLGLTFVAYQSERWLAFALLAAILPAARPEGFAILAMAFVALIAHRRFGHCLLLPIGLLIWSYLGWRATGLSRDHSRDYSWVFWLKHNWPYAEKSTYDAGSIFHFAILMPVIVSPLLFPALLIGVWKSISRLLNTSRQNGLARSLRHHHFRGELALLVIPLGMLAGHSLLYATGRMASNGEERYMLAAAPMWAVLTARGWSWIFRRQRWPFACAGAVAAAMLPVVINRAFIVLPLHYADDWISAQHAADWVLHTPLRARYPKLATCHPGIPYFLDLSPAEPSIVFWRRDRLMNPPDGTILIWDWVYGTHNSSRELIITLDDLATAGWIRIGVPRVQNSIPHDRQQWVFLSPRDVNGTPTSAK